MIEFKNFMRNKVRLLVKDIFISAREFDTSSDSPLDYEMRIWGKCTGTSDAGENEESYITIYYIPALYDILNRSTVEVGQEFIFIIYPFMGYNILADIKEVD